VPSNTSFLQSRGSSISCITRSSSLPSPPKLHPFRHLHFSSVDAQLVLRLLSIASDHYLNRTPPLNRENRPIGFAPTFVHPRPLSSKLLPAISLCARTSFLAHSFFGTRRLPLFAISASQCIKPDYQKELWSGFYPDETETGEGVNNWDCSRPRRCPIWTLSDVFTRPHMLLVELWLDPTSIASLPARNQERL